MPRLTKKHHQRKESLAKARFIRILKEAQKKEAAEAGTEAPEVENRGIFGEAQEEQDGSVKMEVDGPVEVEPVPEIPKRKRSTVLRKKKDGKVSRCLFCYKVVENGASKKVSELEGDFTAMFILKKMLSVPRDKLEGYLKTLGSPSKWISFCDKCSSFVEMAVRLQKEIGKLESDLRRCQEAMIGRIRATWKEGQEMGTSVSSLIANETRKLWVNSTQFVPPPPPGNSEVPSVPQTTPSYIPYYIVVAPVPSVPAPPAVIEATPPVASASTTFPKPCEPRKQVLRKETYGEEEEMEFNFDGGDDEAPSPAGSHSGDVDHPAAMNILIDTDESKALNAGTFSCHLCPNLAEMSAHKLANHVMFHYKRPLKCPQSNLYYASAEDLTKRLSLRRPGNEDHQCSVADLITVKFDTSTRYLWACHVCSENFSTNTERDLHENSEHPKELKDLPPKKYPCSTCDVSHAFRNLAEWRLHRVLEHPSIDAMSCFYCDLTFKSKTKDDIEFFDEGAMIAHVQAEHSLKKRTPPTLLCLPNECLLCGATFSAAKTEGSEGLNRHMKIGHGFSGCQSFACPVPACPTKKSHRTRINEHVESVHRNPEEETFICDQCAFTAPNLKGLDRHKLSEHGVVPEKGKVFKCSKEGCSFQCLEKCKLDRHLMKEHGAERKDKCRFCGKGFLNAKHCREHEEIHQNAGLKPYQCEICGNSFAIKNYLYIHKRLSHQNRPFASTHKKKPPRKKIPAPATVGKLEADGTSSSSNTRDRQEAPIHNDYYSSPGSYLQYPEPFYRAGFQISSRMTPATEQSPERRYPQFKSE